MPWTMTSTADPSPSHARRKALRDADKGRQMEVMDRLPIEKYYNAADRLFEAFSAAQDERRLDDAYVLGIRFATFSIESLPNHCSYKQKQYTALRLRNAQKVEAVLQKIESVTERMDAEEKVKQRQQQKRLQEEEQKRKAKQEEARRLSMEQAKKTRKEIQQSALAKLEAMKQDMANEQANAEASAGKTEATLAHHRKRSAAEAERLAPQQAALTLPHQLPQHKPTGLRPEEEHTIELLNETIARQEERIKDIQVVKIPALLRKGKSKLKAGKRKEALYCVYRKRKWDRNVDVLKAGIFKMETQILRLESAVSDREMSGVMQAATDAMQVIQAGVCGEEVVADDMNGVMAELAKGVEHDMMLDEDELLSELAESTSASQIDEEVSELPGSQDLLSLPSVPSTDMPDAKEQPSLLKAVIS